MLASASLAVMATTPLKPVAVLPSASLAVTVKVKGVPATELAGTDESVSWVAEAGATEMLADETERIPSEALMVWVPTVLKVTAKVPEPLLRELEAGLRLIWVSVELREMVPV